MIRIDDRSKCCGCSACADSCPHSAIRMQADGMGFKYPVVDEDKCVDCGICDEVCAFKKPIEAAIPAAYAVRFPDYLEGSRSGGAGYALMRHWIETGGIVYGAVLGDGLKVVHKRADSLEGVTPMRGSKYVQSDMDGIPSMLLEDIKADREVMFTGTPCQCAGIRSAVPEKYRDRLFLVDFVCHGTPSPSVWSSYVKSLEKREGAFATGADFRDKAFGWKAHKETIHFDTKSISSDEFTFLFYKHLMLRPSCGVCPFSRKERCSDITLGDCWGIDNVLPGFADDDRGCSLVLVSTHRGMELWSNVSSGNEDCVKVNLDDLLQPNLIAPSVLNPRAKSFENDYLRRGYDYVSRRYGKYSLGNRLDRLVKKIKRHL